MTVLHDLAPNAIDRDLRAELRQIEDVHERLELLRAFQESASELISIARKAFAREISDLRDAGMTWTQIGDIFGVSLQRGEQLSKVPQQKVKKS